MLVKDYLMNGADGSKATLQTQIMSYWATFLIYSQFDSEAETMWTKKNLIAIRDLEKDIKEGEKFLQTCYSNEVMEYDSFGNEIGILIGEDGEVVTECNMEVAFRSVTDIVDIFRAKMQLPELEQMTEDEVAMILTMAISDDTIWRNVKSLFDGEVGEENGNVRMLRSQLTLAGPLKI